MQILASHRRQVALTLSEYQPFDDVRWKMIVDQASPMVFDFEETTTTYARRWRFKGFELGQGNASIGPRKVAPVTRIAVPDWALTLPLASRVALWYRGVCRRSARIERGLCWKCGYDLRGIAENCPECGTPRYGSVAGDAEDSRSAQIVSVGDIVQSLAK
jgi:hypothetical protein